MKAAALLLLCSCAHVVTPIPSSLPFVRIDPALAGPVMSRDAAIVIVTKRAEDKAKCDNLVTECEARATRAERGEAAETKRANHNAWWSTYGPPLTIGGAAGWAIAIVLTALAAAKK